MAINKPNVPSAELPDDWGGTQTPYTEQQAQEGYPEAVPTVIDGGNLNYEKRGIFQHIKYFKVFADWLRAIPIGKIPVVNSKGQLDYDDPVTDSEVVHITGDETIEGKKRFKSYQGALYVRFTGSDSMTAPSSDLYNAAIRCEDKNGKNTGNFRNIFSTSGDIITDMQVCREINGTAKFANMGMRMSNTGVVSTFAPTPSTGDNSTQIATTEWYNNKHKVVSALPSSPTAGVTYLIPQTEELTTTSYIPDYASYVDISDKTYTATQDGWIFWRATGTGGQVTVNGVVVGLPGNYTDQPFAQFLVGKGDIITCSAKNMFRFIPFKK